MGETQQFRWFLGIDVSKETFDACCLNSKGERVFNLSTPMNREGFEGLVKQLSSLSIPQEALLVGMESTACYHINLYCFLVSSGYPVMVMNPLLISNFDAPKPILSRSGSAAIFNGEQMVITFPTVGDFFKAGDGQRALVAELAVPASIVQGFVSVRSLVIQSSAYEIL